jgi:hypothetical protein
VSGSPGTLARSGVQLSLPLFRRSGRLPRARFRASVAKSGVSDPSSHLSVVPFSFGVPDGPPRREVRRMLGSRRAYRTTARSVLLFHRLARARGLSSRSRPAGTGRARAAGVDEASRKASSELIPYAPSGSGIGISELGFPGPARAIEKGRGTGCFSALASCDASRRPGVRPGTGPRPQDKPGGFLTAATKVLGQPVDHEGHRLCRGRPGSLGVWLLGRRRTSISEGSGPPGGPGLET